MFKFPDRCDTAELQEAYCVRYQERLHELCIGKMITEQEREANVTEMIPYLLRARALSETGIYKDEVPAFLPKKEDWDGEKIIFDKDFDLDNKAAILHNCRRVLRLNWETESMNWKLIDAVANAEMNCMHDKFWDEEIDNQWLTFL